MYNIEELEKSDKFNSAEAVRNFKTDREYFTALDNFRKDAPLYLRGYTASVIINRPEEQTTFLADAEKIREALTTLEMKESLSYLADLELAVATEDTKLMSDGLLQFYGEMEILTKQVSAAYIKPAPKQEKKEEKKKEEKKEKSGTGAKPTIIAVDDSPEILTAITGMLEDEYRVIALTDGVTAISAAKKLYPSLFILDISMPHMNGIELARRLRSLGGDSPAPILFLTGDAERNTVVKALKQGGNEYILKPVEKDILLSRVRKWVKGAARLQSKK